MIKKGAYEKAIAREKFGRNVLSKRMKLDYTVAKLSELSGINTASIHNYEDGMAFPTPENMEKLTAALQTTEQQLKGE